MPFSLTSSELLKNAADYFFGKEQEVRSQLRHADDSSPLAPHPRLRIGGGERDRTDDPLLAKQVLSQLSYAPMPEDTESKTEHTGLACKLGGSGWT